jgi:hypothetical protein
MSTPGERLSVHKQVSRSETGSEETKYRSTPQAVQVDCAIEIAEALIGLRVAVQSLETNSMIVMNNLIKEIDKATKQAVISSGESTKAAHESANLSQKLNVLTIGIVIAAFLSAGAACVQAWTAWYTVQHPQQQAVLVPSPTVPASPTPQSGAPTH